MAAERKAAPWAKRAFAGYLVVIVLGLLAVRTESSMIRQAFHNIRIEMQTGVVQTQTDRSAGLNAFSLLNLLVEIPVVVLLLTWQFRAASTARLLLLPARRSPGLGVGSWFIPIVNLWFPYQAIRDCLPPGDPGRGVVARMWALFIAVLATNILTSVLAVVGTPIAFLSGAATVALGVAYVGHGCRAVQLIADAHGRLLDPSRFAGP